MYRYILNKICNEEFIIFNSILFTSVSLSLVVWYYTTACLVMSTILVCEVLRVGNGNLTFTFSKNNSHFILFLNSLNSKILQFYVKIIGCVIVVNLVTSSLIYQVQRI
jgi:hypothetical protein